MSPVSPDATIPARVTAGDLAEIIGVELSGVQELLDALGEPSSPGDLVEPSVAVAVAEGLGRNATLEPRDLALESLYEFETRGEFDAAGLPARAETLVRGVVDNQERLDGQIEEVSEHWAVARMPLVDRTILRMGLYELETYPETPTAVVVSEAVRLAKSYSTERSGSFVNGVLASLAKRIRPE